MAGLEEINYLLRANKNIERKLIVTALALLSDDFQISAYRYIGLASLWFADFALADRILGIRDLIAIERPDFAARVEYNRPIRTVEVRSGDSTHVLPDLNLSEKRSIVWMDYEGSIIGCEALQDLPLLCEELPTGSIVFVTVNANSRNLRPGRLREAIGEFLPSAPGRRFMDQKEFPANLGVVISNAMEHFTRVTGRPVRFMPLFDFYYKDGAPMVTVGGMIANEEDQPRLERCERFLALDYVRPATQVRILAPPLTTREKLALDRLFPVTTAPTMEQVAALGFTLNAEQIAAYHAYHRHYPLFGEIQG